MSKKLHSAGYPRKFSDKIALIKQKEAVTNACFESAIQGLSDISMKRMPSNNAFISKEKLKVLPVEDNITKLKDDFSITSVSPQSFISDSTNCNPLSNDNNCQGSTDNIREPVNNSFQNFYENAEGNNFSNIQSHSSVKFRYGNGNSKTQFEHPSVYSKESYPNSNPNVTKDLNDQVCSGSLPDVSMFNNGLYMHSNINQRYSYGSQNYPESLNQESINLKEALSSLDKVKKASNSKKALFEHLKSRGVQNHFNIHPHHVSLAESTSPNLASMINNPSINRGRSGYIHNNDSVACAGTNNENGHLQHYLPSNSPYLSIPIRDSQSNKDSDSSFRKRHASGNTISAQHGMEFKFNDSTDNTYNSRYKSLTPTDNIQTNWINYMNNGKLLSPTIYGLSTDNYRRVASDSSLQNSLKQYIDNISQDSVYKDENVSGRMNTYRSDPAAHMYHRIKSMTSDPIDNFQDPLFETQKSIHSQRENSASSSFIGSYICPNSPDENIDPNLDFIVTPESVPRQIFKFGNPNKLSEESSFVNSNNQTCSCQNVTNNLSQISSADQRFGIVNPMNFEEQVEMTIPSENNQQSLDSEIKQEEQGDHCYWTQQSESNSYGYSKEPSPKIVPCENLDPKNVSLDLNTEFSLPDIILSDVDVPRRDSLNMADEVLGNLGTDSNNLEYVHYRDKLTVYQPMDVLSEEPIGKVFENEY